MWHFLTHYRVGAKIAGQSGSIALQAVAIAGKYPTLLLCQLDPEDRAGSTALGHDARGNLTGSGGDTFGYSSENFLTGYSHAQGSGTLSYDPLGRLYRYTAPQVDTRFAYDGIDMIGEYNASGTLLRRYVHGPGIDNPLVWYEGAGTAGRRYLHKDERGSVIAVSNASGAMLAINSYDEYGIPGTGGLGRFRYTGQTWLPELGLYYYKARMYSPTLGRFMQTDPIGYADGMNMYAYVGGDPVNMVDPLGLCSGESGGATTENVIVVHCKTEEGGGGGPPPRSRGPSGPPSGPFGPGGGGRRPPKKEEPQNDMLPCQDKSLAVRLGEGALDGLGLLGDGAQVLGAYTGFVPLAAAGTAAEYVSIGGSALLHWSTGDTAGLAEDGLNFAAGAVPGGRIARRVGGAAADWGRRSNGQFAQGWNRKQKAQNAAYSSGQSTAASGGSLCPVKSG